MKSEEREEKLEDSMLSLPSKYKMYSLGKTRILKKLGNPFFGGEPKDGETWDLERKMGTAWVIFTHEAEEIAKIMDSKDPLSEIDKIWETNMHYRELETIYNWIIREAGLTEAAQTEAVKESRGKQEAG